mgnify:CR=1 FL=1
MESATPVTREQADAGLTDSVDLRPQSVPSWLVDLQGTPGAPPVGSLPARGGGVHEPYGIEEPLRRHQAGPAVAGAAGGRDGEWGAYLQTLAGNGWRDGVPSLHSIADQP